MENLVTEMNILQQITERSMTTMQVTPDILLLQFPLVNAILVGTPGANAEWNLIGAGMAHTAKDILQAAEGNFGKGSQPKAIILTHGHFDHVGAIVDLTNTWQNTTVYAHHMELPYLTGQQDYPPADPNADNGLIAKISPTFPYKGINLGDRVQPLPADGGVPGMYGWRWIHTPGHSPGHISLFRDSDHILIVGDAFTTLKQDSAQSVLSRKKEIYGPPKYFTTDWPAAKNSVKVLKDLNPSMVIPSHGLPMQGEELKQQLENLVNNFDSIAKPISGRYVH